MVPGANTGIVANEVMQTTWILEVLTGAEGSGDTTVHLNHYSAS